MPERPGETSAVEYEVRVAAPPEVVFAHFTDPAGMAGWMGSETTLDPRPGGICRIVFRPSPAMTDYLELTFGSQPGGAGPGETRVMMGRYVEVVPPRRIVLTWGWERELYAMPPQSTAVEVTFTPDGEDTIVHLVHRRLPADAVEFHRAGWQYFLSRLVSKVATYISVR